MPKQKASKLITIIVPCYNIESYIDSCLRSILSQNIINKCQVICINDGCTDKTPNIIEKHAKKHPEVIQTLEQYNKMGVANLGVSRARNMGLGFANGETVMFVDGDDIIGNNLCIPDLINGEKLSPLYTDKHYLEACYDTLMSNPESSMVIGGITFVSADGDLAFATQPQRTLFRELYGNKLNTPQKQLDFLSRRMTSCATLYRNNIIQQNNIRFNPHFTYFEDTDFIMKYALAAHKEYSTIFTPLLNNDTYLYRRRLHSAMMKLSLHSERDFRRLVRTKNKLIYYAQTLTECAKQYGTASFIYNKIAHRYVQTEKEMEEYSKYANPAEYKMLRDEFIPYDCLRCNNHNCGACEHNKKLIATYSRCLHKLQDRQK